MARRLAAILAADVVGYSRLMAADEAGTLARLKALQTDLIGPLVAGLHGRIVKLMGDGALVEFPSVVEAVQCAVEVQRGVAERQGGLPEEQRIALRIGVNLGDVIIEGEDIHGDGVNVAARLEALAEPGGVLISRTVRDHVQDSCPIGSRISASDGSRTSRARSTCSGSCRTAGRLGAGAGRASSTPGGGGPLPL